MLKFTPFWIGAYVLTFLPILLSLVAGIGHGFSTGDWSPLGRSAGDAVFGADQKIYESTQVLLDAESVPIEDDALRNTYLDALRNNVAHGFVLLFLMWFLVFKLVKFIWSNPGVDNFQHKLLWAGIALFVVMVVELVYVGAVLGEGFIIPFRGVGLALQHLPELFSFELPTSVINQSGNFS